MKSDNLAQAKMELAGLNAEYVTPESTYAAVYINGLDADVQQVALKASPTDMLSLGAVFFDFSNTSGGLMDAQELDLYAEWVVSPNLIISPLIGIYKPDNAVALN